MEARYRIVVAIDCRMSASGLELYSDVNGLTSSGYNINSLGLLDSSVTAQCPPPPPLGSVRLVVDTRLSTFADEP